jgi:hypothetical protein
MTHAGKRFVPAGLLAVSTKGSFSVRMPIPFNDFTVRSTDAKTGEEVTYVIGAEFGRLITRV